MAAKKMPSFARATFDRFGEAVCRDYMQRPPDVKLFRCQNGHEDCAHILRGPCLQELAQIVELMS